MAHAFPRVTYSNTTADFSTLHAYLDREIPAAERDVLGREHGNIIGASFDDQDGETFEVHSPISRNILVGRFVEASPAAVGRAVEAARKAYPAWSATPWTKRVALLRAWADVVERHKYRLGIAALLEIGKSRLEAIGEAEEVCDIIRYYCDEMERHNGYAEPLRRAFPQEETVSLLRPLGVFGIVAPFNFPLALTTNMLVGALVTGNTAVLKPSPHCGLTARMIFETMREAGLPEGIASLVIGGDAVGGALVDDPRLAGVAFTGSYAAGMAIYRKLAQGPHAKPVVAEMGGKNPAYVTAKANLATAVEGVARSAFGMQGQKCSACSVVYVEDTVADVFVAELKAFTEKLVVGDPRRQGVFMGPIYNEQAAGRFLDASRLAASTGRIVTGGDRLTGGLFDEGHYLAPTVVTQPGPGPLTRDELFAPFVVVRPVANLAAGLAEGNDVAYGLSAGIYTTDEDELETFLRGAEAGVLYANRASGATTGAWPGIQSFCGWKGSGVSSKGGLGPRYLPQFMREQSHTLMR